MATRLSRADSLTTEKQKQEYFSDFLNSFDKTPVGDNLAKYVNETSVKQSIKNLIYTSLGERLYQPNIGGGVYKLLFELNDPVSMGILDFNIRNVIKNNEPRVTLLDLNISQETTHSVTINIIFALINNPDPISLDFLIKRVR